MMCRGLPPFSRWQWDVRLHGDSMIFLEGNSFGHDLKMDYQRSMNLIYHSLRALHSVKIMARACQVCLTDLAFSLESGHTAWRAPVFRCLSPSSYGAARSMYRFGDESSEPESAERRERAAQRGEISPPATNVTENLAHSLRQLAQTVSPGSILFRTGAIEHIRSLWSTFTSYTCTTKEKPLKYPSKLALKRTTTLADPEGRSPTWKKKIFRRQSFARQFPWFAMTSEFASMKLQPT